MIVVTGATGQLGRAVVAALLRRLPADRVAVSVRDPERARGLHEQGVRVRRGDFADPASLANAFEGATRVLVVSTDGLGEVAVAGHRAAIRAAAQAGAERIVYTSHMGVDPASPFPPMRDHAAAEADLAASGVAFTALRNGFYATFPVTLLQQALATGELVTPHDGPVAWTAHADLAEAAALALAADEFDGPTPPLTGPESLDMAQVAAIAAGLAGRPVRHAVVPEADYRAGLLAHGLPEPVADMLVGLFAASRQGAFAPADPTLQRLLGRPATSMSEVLAAAGS